MCGYNSTVADAGCGPSSAAIILSGFGTNDTPETVARSLQADGGWDGECSFFTDKGFKATFENIINWDKAVSHLSSGKPMVVSITSYLAYNGVAYSSHFITFLDIKKEGNETYIYIGDPAGGNGWIKLSYLKQHTGSFGAFFYVSK